VAEKVKEKWSLTADALDKLLGSLDSDRDHAAHIYEEIRSQLVRIFIWRGCPYPEDYADETINRVAHKLADGERLADLPTYFFGVARMLVKEFHRKQQIEREALQKLSHATNFLTQSETTELRISCLERCLGEQPENAREMILAYYHGAKRAKIDNRKLLAKRLKVSLNTLRMQALRLRDKLESCVNECVGRSAR
jgi:DNA-directed RNA polymerase specialized sigma24 family protein